MVQTEQLKVGEKRKFSFNKDWYTIREILDQPNINFFWSYDNGICPHCKKKLTRDVEYVLNKIEILGIDGKEDKNLTKEDIIIHGFSVDNRNLILTEDKFDEVFEKSNNFKKLKKELKEVN